METWHNHEILVESAGDKTTTHTIMHSHRLPPEKGHTHQAIIGPATTTEEVPA